MMKLSILYFALLGMVDDALRMLLSQDQIQEVFPQLEVGLEIGARILVLEDDLIVSFLDVSLHLLLQD
jgi:hypothetical protein